MRGDAASSGPQGVTSKNLLISKHIATREYFWLLCRLGKIFDSRFPSERRYLGLHAHWDVNRKASSLEVKKPISDVNLLDCAFRWCSRVNSPTCAEQAAIIVNAQRGEGISQIQADSCREGVGNPERFNGKLSEGVRF